MSISVSWDMQGAVDFVLAVYVIGVHRDNCKSVSSRVGVLIKLMDLSAVWMLELLLGWLCAGHATLLIMVPLKTCFALLA